MIEGFDWVPFYEEMAQQLLTYRTSQRELVLILDKAGVKGLVDQDPEESPIPLEVMDPFTFTSLINKHSYEQIIKILEIVRWHLGIREKTPSQFLGIPKSDARQAWLFPYKFERNSNDLEKLWNLYEAVVTGGGALTEFTFSEAQSVRYAGKAKLTQAIFRAAPRNFFPVDGQTTRYLARRGLEYRFKTAKDYLAICSQVSKKIPKTLFEQSHDAWAENQKESSGEDNFQSEVLKQATKASIKSFVEPKGGVALPNLKKGAPALGYQRNAKAAGVALSKAEFLCEIDPTHQTFVSSAKDRPYVEAHHLVPLSMHDAFNYSLDVTANIVALCPTCHRLLHHGKNADKKQHLRMLFQKRKDDLLEKEIDLSERDLLKYYEGDLVEDES